MKRERYLSENIIDDLKNKMVFVGGARQVGKTTLARDIVANSFENPEYFNWDYQPDRKKITSYEFPGNSELLIFDEIHKFKKWKSTIKGLYDKSGDKYKIMVTGSARMNIYRKGGDSLQGRYHYFTLHPFTLAELNTIKHQTPPFAELNFKEADFYESLTMLDKFGGFPEVIINQSAKTLRRWQNEKLERLFREDVRDTDNIRDLSNMKLLGDMLPSKVASPLSVNAIREDLEVSHRAVSSWLSILELFYYHYRIYPYHTNLIRSLKKEAKLYLTDWSEVENDGARFENLIAGHLLKFVNYLKESEGYKAELNYLRTVEKKEVDFLISIDKKPWFAVEVKLSDTSPSKHLTYFNERLNIPFLYQVVKSKDIDIYKDGVRVMSADKFLSGLI